MGERKVEAMKAFYGTPDVARQQEVFTPLALLQPLLQAWDTIALDPCAHVNSPVVAEDRWFGNPTVYGSNGVPTEWDGRGLVDPWPDRTYCNPPFSNLQAWIEHCQRQTTGRYAMLAPARLQRPWLRKFLLANYAVALNSVKFCGYDTAFPQALLIVTNDPAVADAYGRSGLGDRIL